MNTLFIDKKEASVTLKASRIVTAHHTVPTKLIDLLILTQDAHIAPRDILGITNANIPILYMSSDSKRFALTLPAIAKNSDLKIQQYHALHARVEIAREFLHRKFTTHKSSLEPFDIVIDIAQELESLAHATTIEELLGIEGSFARRYFGHYFALFERKLTRGYRSKNPPEDPVNAVLSYLYTLGYHTLTAKLYMRGFDPSISYLHTPFRDHFALSSDLMEGMRGAINTFVARLFLEGHLRLEDFTTKNGVYLKTQPRRALWSHIKPFMTTLNKQANHDIATLKKRLDHVMTSSSKPLV